MKKHNRLYKSGSIWAFWRWTDVTSEYITRLHIIKTPWFAMCMHWINKPDPEPFLHDHPVSFLSLILHGGYNENRNGIIKCRNVWNFIKASQDDKHSIVSVLPNTVTICFMGPKVREWGFHTSNGWMYWKDYYKEKNENTA